MRQAVILLVAVSIATPAATADWPSFAGPTRDLQSPETGLLKSWPSKGPQVLWSVNVGRGFGGVAVHSGKVYLLDRGRNVDNIRCFNLADGKEEWNYQYEAPGKFSYPGSRSHPSVDEKYVFTLGPKGDLYCINKKTRKPKWNVNVVKGTGGKVPNWGISQAPALYKDLIIVAPVGSKAGMVAFKKETGDLTWKSSPLPGDISYASPMPSTIDGVDQVITVTTTTILGVDAQTGKMLWQTGEWKCRIPIATPVHLGNGKVFVTGGYDAGCAMFLVKKRGTKFTVRTVFKTRKSNGQIRQPILYKDHLYMNGNDKGKRDGLVCMDLKGSVKWKTGKDPGFDWGGLLMADGVIYAVDGAHGDLCIIKPDPSGYKELSRAKGLLNRKQAWASMALSDGKLLIRDQSRLKCINVKE